MPAAHLRRKERPLIELFLSEYDSGAFRGCSFDWLEDKEDGAVEVLATNTNGQTLAIEHTLIQPFTGEKQDADRFAKTFWHIEQDVALIVPGRDIEIAIPVGALRKGYNWNSICDDVRSWFVTHRQSLPEGMSRHAIVVGGGSKKGPFPLNVQLSVVEMPGTSGACRIGRCDVPNSLREEVVRVLETKVPKLANTPANRRILLLERDQIFPSFLNIYAEIEKLESTFCTLNRIDEIWFANTAGLATEQYVGFSLIDPGGLVEIMNFGHGVLTSRRNDRVIGALPNQAQ